MGTLLRKRNMLAFTDIGYAQAYALHMYNARRTVKRSIMESKAASEIVNFLRAPDEDLVCAGAVSGGSEVGSGGSVLMVPVRVCGGEEGLCWWCR